MAAAKMKVTSSNQRSQGFSSLISLNNNSHYNQSSDPAAVTKIVQVKELEQNNRINDTVLTGVIGASP